MPSVSYVATSNVVMSENGRRQRGDVPVWKLGLFRCSLGIAHLFFGTYAPFGGATRFHVIVNATVSAFFGT